MPTTRDVASEQNVKAARRDKFWAIQGYHHDLGIYSTSRCLALRKYQTDLKLIKSRRLWAMNSPDRGDWILDCAVSIGMMVARNEAAMTVNFTAPIFADENKAREHLESLLWPSGPVCPRCGLIGEGVNKLPVGRSKASKRHPEGKPVYGQHYCNACRRTFTVTNGTVMERSHIRLTAWVGAFHLYAASKKGFSAHQLHRSLGLTYKSAWFLAMRVREAMGDTDTEMLGGEDKIVEVDETYIGKGARHVSKRTGKIVKSQKGEIEGRLAC